MPVFCAISFLCLADCSSGSLFYAQISSHSVNPTRGTNQTRVLLLLELTRGAYSPSHSGSERWLSSWKCVYHCASVTASSVFRGRRGNRPNPTNVHQFLPNCEEMPGQNPLTDWSVTSETGTVFHYHGLSPIAFIFRKGTRNDCCNNHGFS